MTRTMTGNKATMVVAAWGLFLFVLFFLGRTGAISLAGETDLAGASLGAPGVPAAAPTDPAPSYDGAVAVKAVVVEGVSASTAYIGPKGTVFQVQAPLQAGETYRVRVALDTLKVDGGTAQAELVAQLPAGLAAQVTSADPGVRVTGLSSGRWLLEMTPQAAASPAFDLTVTVRAEAPQVTGAAQFTLRSDEEAMGPRTAIGGLGAPYGAAAMP